MTSDFLHAWQVTLFESKISSGNAEQALSRDFSRLCEQMDLTRLLSFFHSSNGFYWSNLFVIWSTSWFVYVQILISIVIPDQASAGNRQHATLVLPCVVDVVVVWQQSFAV